MNHKKTRHFNYRPLLLCFLLFLNFFLAASPFSGASPLHIEWSKHNGISLQHQGTDQETSNQLNDVFDVSKESKYIQRKQKKNFQGKTLLHVYILVPACIKCNAVTAIPDSCDWVKPNYFSFLSLFYLY